MFDLSATDRVKLKAIIAAGGLRDLRDILRISMAPEHAGDAAQWHLYLERNHDNLQSWVEQVCDPRDIVALNENVLTIIRHPGSLIPSEALRMDVITRLSDRLRGHATLQLPKLTFTSEPVGGAMAWLSDAVKSAAVSLAHPGADSASDETAHAARIAAEGLNAETPEAAQFWCQAVVCSDGGAALFLRLPARDRLDLRRLHLSGKDQAYFSPGDISLDLAAIEQVIQLAQRQLDAKRSPLLPLLLPLNINNLRQSERRRQLLQDLRDVPSELSQMIEPVFVRCVDGIPQSAFVDAAAYLRPTFQMARVQDWRSDRWHG
jgi:hypothetical protein